MEQENLIDWFKAMPWKPGHSPVRWVPEKVEVTDASASVFGGRARFTMS